jgi:hypothetical protein
MSKKVVVHTGVGPGTPLVEEREALDAPDIELILRGPCSTVAEVLEAVRDAAMASAWTASIWTQPPS